MKANKYKIKYKYYQWAWLGSYSTLSSIMYVDILNFDILLIDNKEPILRLWNLQLQRQRCSGKRF
jgi:hypothetical protein